jgi:hypothetical protein
MNFKEFIGHVKRNDVYSVETGLSANPDWVHQKDERRDATPLVHAAASGAVEVASGEFHDQGDAKWIVIRGQLRGHNDTPCGGWWFQ